ncbi:hypothetical protein [Tibeticola sp.]|uniref:hypothetical protein n=1 Tax=Tibeticola sp. TaxID=2005368 RepID=UPI0025F98F8C|nr:hypothetical protein [Tibeticola sp.]
MQSTVSTNPLGAGVWRAAFITGLAVAAVAAVQPAHARDNVIWSVGVASPGVSIGLSNAAPVYVQPAPVYVQPAPVYVQPAPVVVRPVPVQPIAWVPPGYVVREAKRHHHHHPRPEWYEGPRGWREGPGYRY